MQLQRVPLTINGVERFLLCSPDDVLSEALRRHGFLGVKVGCGTGVCGACTIILNGKVVRCCNTKMSKVEDHSEILTIEGLGIPQSLHPLQQAWVTYGAAQCGFCSPGFIVSAYGLLLENPAPSREEVRDWFRAHRNICRCTGYKPIVDAVMAAAEVMRGEKTMDDIIYKHPENSEYYGSYLPRPSAVSKVTGQADYGDDLKYKLPQGAIQLVPVIAEVNHATIVSIDIAEAEEAPGVFKVLTAKDVKGTNNLAVAFGHIVARQKGNGVTDYPVIADKKICRRGDVVAVVCADTEAHAKAAAKLVKQELEILPEYKTFVEAAMPNALQIHKDVPNVYMYAPVFKGEVDDDSFDGAAYSAGGSFHSQHEPHLPIEPDVMQGYIGTDGMYTIQCKSQAITETMEAVSVACGIPMENLRMIENTVGGAFGYSVGTSTFAIMGAALVALEAPCTMTLTYEQFNHMTGKRSSTFTNGRIACDGNGKITAAEYDVGLDHGAYAGSGGLIFNNLISIGFHGYNIPAMRGLARGGASNNAFNCPYRGFGSPQIYTTTEALIDMLAEKAGIDPWEFRYLNAARPGDTTINSRPYFDYVYPALLEMAKPYYDRYKAEAEEGKKNGKMLGVGISLGGFLATIGRPDHADIALELNPDGTITHFGTWEDVGQGGDIGTVTVTLEAFRELGYLLRPDQVKCVMNDSKLCPDTGLAAASRMHYMCGNATRDGAKNLLDAMRKPDGTYRTHDEMAAEGIPTKAGGHVDHFGHVDIDFGLDPNTGEGIKDRTYMYAVNTCLVEVNPDTGKATVVRYTTACDVGKVGNRLAVDGQAYGGLSHSIGFALSEDYDSEKKYGNMAACGIPTIDAVPDDFNVLYYEGNPRELGPFGSSGCSECFQSSGHMAVINGIRDASGVRVYALPATPDKIKAGLEKLANGEDLTPPPYYLGSDFEDELDYIRANPIVIEH
ncbi:MAG: molybdopterin-dependent oxidoreductase [Clostridiales Family XIII bacterium]|jgi:aldehyde oxidoreductase|nr:molybdopterin-dependent oxidoreductase [Clostridiales Family XIII bacterium]